MLKMDTQNVVKMTSELNRDGISYSVMDEWHVERRL